MMTYDQALAHVHLHCTSSHNTNWKENREAWDIVRAHLTSREAKGDEKPVAWIVTDPSIGYWGSANTERNAKDITEQMQEAGYQPKVTPLFTRPAAQEAAKPVVPDDVIKAAALDCARRAYGYWKGDSTGSDSAMTYFDRNMGLGGITHTIELMESAIRKAMIAASQPARGGEVG